VKNRRRRQMHRNRFRNPIIWMGVIITPLLALLLWDETENLIEKFQSKKKVAGQDMNLTATQESLCVDDVNSLSFHHLIEKQKDGELQRQVYPYSVVDGGVHSVQDLRSAIWRDPVVAKHYLNFRLDRARVIEAKADKYFHVSYRIGGEIFWTRKRLKVAKGERLITDGTNFTRTRCANVLSDVPQGKTAPDEPAPEVLDAPLNPPSDPTPYMPSVVAGGGPLNPPSDATPFMPPSPVPNLDTDPDPVPVAGPGLVPLSGPFPGPGPVPLPGPFPGPVPDPGPDPPPAPVPEPSTMFLLGSGLLGLLGYGRKKLLKK